MRLKSFSTQVFAGINDLEITFSEGLNILLGPNEAGKSTIVNAIFATLFKEPKIKSRTNEDKEFNRSFLPYPEGDYIHGCLTLVDNGSEYTLEKKWSKNNPSVLLELPDGSKIDSQDRIDGYKQEILLYGENTYNNIVFAKQSEVKTAVKNIAESPEVKNTVNNFLRRAVMKMEGVVTDELKDKIISEKDRLLAKWDLEEGRPTNPDRDYRNPYQVGTGEIYEAYLAREKTREKMEQAERAEEEYQDLSSDITSLVAELHEIEEEITELSKIEDDVYERGQLEPKLTANLKEQKESKEIIEKWPEVKNKVEKEKESLKELENELDSLNQEKENFKKHREKEELGKKLTKIQDLEEEITDKKKLINKFNSLDKSKVDRLTALEKDIANAKARLEAARLKARINRSAYDDLTAIMGISEEESVRIGEEFEADGYLRIQNEEIDIEVQSAEIDFEDIKNKLKEAAEEYQAILEELSALEIEDSEKAREKLSRKNELKKDLKRLQQNIEDILEGREYEKLKEEYESIEVEGNVRDIQEIEKEISKLRDKKIGDLKVSIGTKEDALKNWQDKYDSLKNLETTLEKINNEIRRIENKLADLAEVPASFNSADDFRSHLKDLRKRKEHKTEKMNEKKTKILEVENKMPDSTCEELKQILRDKEREFNRLTERSENILKLEKTFNETVEMMDRKSFDPLINSFSTYLSELTAGSYEADSINNDFEIEIVKKEEDKKIPVDMNILSFGTYDGVALALRFALYENLFQDKPGFIVLDDCLVNLDPRRTENAINLIAELEGKYQIIYTTCNPETAKRLGGNVIEL